MKKRKEVKIELDLDVETLKLLRKVSKMTNLSIDKVINVILSIEIVKGNL